MSKPPRTPPHSDLDGVREDERRHIDSANEAGQDSGDLENARRHSKGRPPYDDDHDNPEDRSG